jgi:uncharacterized membrane protein
MDQKQYMNYKKIVAIGLMIVATVCALINRNDITAMAALVAFFILRNLRKKFTGVLSDERTEKVAAKAAQSVLFASIILLFFAGNLLQIFSAMQPEAKVVGDTIEIIVSLLILAYLVMYYYYNQKIQ